MNDIFQDISYDELIEMFDYFKTGLVYIGGNWCKTCVSVMDNVKKVAKLKHLDKIYHFDPVFENIYGEKEDLRDCKSLEVKLKYYAIIEKMGFKSNEKVKDTLIPRMHVPFFIAIKHGNCAGYYSIELLKDNDKLYTLDDQTNDKTMEFEDNLAELISKIETDDLF